MYVSPLKPIKSSSNVIDIACMSGATYLDKSSYVWAYGGSSQLISSSIPVIFPVCSNQFVSLIHGGNYNTYAALDASSYAWIWGAGSSGQIGNNRNNEGWYPQSVIGGKQWLTISGANSSSFHGLDYSSYAWAWGAAYLGDGTGSSRSSPVSVIGDRQFITMKAYTSAYALDSSSYLWAWGDNTYGQLGNGSQSVGSSPVSVIGDRQFIDFWPGKYFVIARDSSSYLWAWGYNAYGSFGNNTLINTSSPISVLDNTWKKLYVGGSTGGVVFAENINGNIYSWGNNTSGVLGQGTSGIHVSVPTVVRLPFTIKKLVLSTNVDTAIALDTNSNVWAWGKGSALGNGINTDTSYPNKPAMYDRSYKLYTPAIPRLVFPSQGSGLNTIFLDQSSYAWGWGSLYPGTFLPASFPTNKQWCDLRVSCDANSGVGSKIVGMDNFSYAWMWGYGGGGHLGNNNNINTSVPVSVVGNMRWLKVIPFDYGAYGVDFSSYLWAWGGNANGSLGDNTISSRSSPISVIGGRQVLKVVASFVTCCFLDSSSYAWTFGSGSTGTLGNNNTPDRSSPVSVVGGKQFINLGSSYMSIYGLDNNSYLWAWGRNDFGQLGDNTIINRSSPVSVVGGMQFVSLPDNNTSPSMYAINASSYLWVWGSNTNGTLGTGDSVNKSSPVSYLGGPVNYAVFTANSLTAQINYSQYYYSGQQQTTINYNSLANFSGTNSSYSTPFIVTFPTTFMISPVLGGRRNIFGK